MTKYNELFKFQIVQEYLKGPLGIKLLARKLVQADSVLGGGIREIRQGRTEG